MANGYIVGKILDLNSPYSSTGARVEIWKGAAKVRTLYLTKAAASQYWYYSTSIAPYTSYTVKAFDTSVPHTYQPGSAPVQDSQAFVVDFMLRAEHADGHVHRGHPDWVTHMHGFFALIVHCLKKHHVGAVIELDE
jgi:hypothetical protein